MNNQQSDKVFADGMIVKPGPGGHPLGKSKGINQTR